MEGKISIGTYNCRGLPIGKWSHNYRPAVQNLLDSCDIVCLQETWLATQELPKLNDIHPNFHGIGESTTNLRDRIKTGRIAGGVAILWSKKLDLYVKEVRLDVNWACGVEVSINNKKCVIVNVYTPYESVEHEDEYICRLAVLRNVISELESTCVFIMGDFNSDITKPDSVFGEHLIKFCSDNDLFLSSKLLLPADSFTYISDAWHTSSWLDHIVSTEDAHYSISGLAVLYDEVLSDHIPIKMDINFESIPELAKLENGKYVYSPDWQNLHKESLVTYREYTEELLRDMETPSAALKCRDVHCKNDEHRVGVGAFYNNMTDSLIRAGEALISRKHVPKKCKPGWNEHVRSMHHEARKAFKHWCDEGKPRQGEIFEYKKIANARFKYAVRFIKRHEQEIKRNILANNFNNLDHRNFWKNINKIKNKKSPLPTNIEGVTDKLKIAEMWKDHYTTVLNCLPGKTGELRLDVKCSNQLDVSYEDVEGAIKALKYGKSNGPDNLCAEHLKFASPLLYKLLADCFTSFFVHGYLPESIMSVMLIPIIKNKSGKINSMSNYRPIAVASVLSKAIENIILQRAETFIITNQNQFGFKKHLGTDQCIYALKEILAKYHKLNSPMFLCFLDASKAFDRVNHFKLFQKLIDRGCPAYITRILVYWYANQKMSVKWDNVYSEVFQVTNGVRQGGILSPYLYNLYIDGLSDQLNRLQTGCIIGGLKINHIMYADDVVIFSPYSAGLQQLIDTCVGYANDHDILYNTTKSAVMILRTKWDKHSRFPKFNVGEYIIDETDKIKYLGHIIKNDLTDDEDITNQCKLVYARGNAILRQFRFCSTKVKVQLFRSFCSSFYCAQIWWNYRSKSLNRIKVAFNDIMRFLMGVPRHTSASSLFAELGVPAFMATIRNCTNAFMGRLGKSTNAIIADLVGQNQQSDLWHFWRQSVHTIYM